ncbi:hypothetical protein K438DRAFT_1770695 [Mycena galopus ATCC 62051]|nr:hypothetical protein K438DRAFT_1770695 [Mycena galopus ATCC 62051]
MADNGTTLTQDCSGDDTCLRHFEYKPVLDVATKHTRILGLPQCLGCGATSSRLDSDHCGQCVNKDKRCLGGQVTSGSSDVPALPQGLFAGQSAGQSTSSVLRNLGQYNRNNWKDAAHINDSGIRVQQPTVPITGLNMATLRSNNLATTKC